MNLRPSGYEPDELPDCSTPRRVDIYSTTLEFVKPTAPMLPWGEHGDVPDHPGDHERVPRVRGYGLRPSSRSEAAPHLSRGAVPLLLGGRPARRSHHRSGKEPHCPRRPCASTPRACLRSPTNLAALRVLTHALGLSLGQAQRALSSTGIQPSLTKPFSRTFEARTGRAGDASVDDRDEIPRP